MTKEPDFENLVNQITDDYQKKNKDYYQDEFNTKRKSSFNAQDRKMQNRQKYRA